MVFWIIATLAAALVAAMLITSLRRGGSSVSARDSDMAVYKDQLAEVDRDLAKGTLTEAEAEATRTEIARRLLDADKRSGETTDTAGPGTLATIAVVLTIAVGGLGLYAVIGAPGVPDLPLDDRLDTLADLRANRPSQALAEEQAAPNLRPPAEIDDEVRDIAARLRGVMAENPNDLQGLTFLARTEAQLGNYAASRAALDRIVTLKGNDATLEDRLTLLETMIFAAGGYVSPEAETLIGTVLTDEPGNMLTRYYQGLLELQSGRPDRTFPIWLRLLDVAPPDAPFLPVIRSELPIVAARAGVRYEPPQEAPGPSAADIAAAQDMSIEDRQAMIEGMVAGLSDRLATEGGPPEDWARLITALGVLGNTEQAKAIADEATTVFADDARAQALIGEARMRAGISE